MTARITTCFSGLFLVLFLFACKKDIGDRSCKDADAASAATAARTPQAGAPVLVTGGLNNPRGLEFGADGWLYVAEAGIGGPGSPVGGGVSKVNVSNGAKAMVTMDLPTQTDAFGSVNGPVDLAFMGGTLYVLTDGGASYGVPSKPSGIYTVSLPSGSTALYANLSQWQQTHPVADPPADFSPDGSWYNLSAVNGALYAVDANHGELVKVASPGAISRVTDFSATQGHIVPTAMDYRGNFYVGNLGTFPIQPGSASIRKVNPSGSIQTVVSGLSAIVGLVIDQRSWMYVLEMGEQPFSFAMPGQGMLYAISPSGEKTLLAGGLNFPTALTMGPDGNLYVSVWGFGGTPGQGQIMRIPLQ